MNTRSAFVTRLEEIAQTRPALVWVVVLMMTALVALGDIVTSAEVAFTALYFVPISVGGWFQGRKLAALAAMLATATWLVMGILDQTHRSLALYAWNLVVQAVVFGTVAYLVPSLRAALSIERAGRASAERDLEHAQRLTTVGRMAAGIAHELGTPLNVAGSYSRMIQQADIVGEEARTSAGIVAEQVHFMTGIIRKMLDFARAQEPQRTTQSLSELVNGSVSLLSPVVKQKHVELSFETPPPLPLIEVDAGQLRQVFSNLIINAVQASPEGGHVRVSVGEATRSAPVDLESTNKQWLVVEVQDEGSGIASDLLPRIFDPFFTTKPVGEGTGLGLAVVWGIVRKHEGWIDVESTEGKGSRFSVYLPKRRAPEGFS